MRIRHKAIEAIAALVSSAAAAWSNGKLAMLRVSSRNDCRSADWCSASPSLRVSRSGFAGFSSVTSREYQMA